MNTERIGLLTLPRELRDKIYDHLLRIDRFSTLKCDAKGPSSLDLSILRVNRQSYQEASKILYEENPWVCITIEPYFLEKVCQVRVGIQKRLPGGTGKGFVGQKPVPMVSYARTVAVATATITLQRCLHPGEYRISLQVSLFTIPRLCRILTSCSKIRREIDIRVHLNKSNVGKVKEAWAESLLDCFSEARGFGYAAISDAQGTSHVELALLMMSPFDDFQEIADRAATYHDRALEEQELGRLSKARCDYHDGHDFIFWYIFASRCLGNPHEKDKSKFKLFIQLWADINFSCAFLCIKLGDLDWAFRLLSWTLDGQPQGEQDLAQTEAWFLHGLRDQALGAGNGAAYCFLQTLRNQPGHRGADEAVDKLELELQSCTGLTERIILQNIEHVLQPFRHQAHDSAVMSKDDYDLLVQQWYAGKREVGSTGYSHITRGSVSLTRAAHLRQYWW